jgi:NitT/TauT family transport system substrate-binding protein
MRLVFHRPSGRRLARAAAAALACAGVATYALSSEATAGAKTLNPINIALIPAFGSEPLEVALVKGFFAQNGLQVTLTPVQAPPTGIAALNSQFQIALGSPQNLFAAASQGLNVGAISGMQVVDAKHPNSVLLAAQPITAWSQLEGKKVGVISLAGGSAQAVEYNLLQAHIPLSSVTFVAVPVATMPDAITAGTIYAAISAVPFFTGISSSVWVGTTDVLAEAIQAYTKGKQTSTQSALMIANKLWAAHNPVVVKEYRTALTEAIAWMNANQAGARSILATWLGLPTSIANAAPFPALSATITATTLQAEIGMSTYVGALPSQVPAATSLLVPGAQTPIKLPKSFKK